MRKEGLTLFQINTLFYEFALVVILKYSMRKAE